jgi:hypothetical protein
MSDPQPSGDLVPGMVTVIEPAPYQSQAPAQQDHFDLALRGYDRHQVDRYVYAASVLVEQLRAELSQTAQRELAATAELVRIQAEHERGKPSFDALGERVTQMLGLAEREAAQLRSDAERDAAALRHASEREAADTRSDARREAEELGAAARREMSDLVDQRVELLTEIASIRDTLNGVLATTPEQWPSLAPTDAAVPSDILGDESTDDIEAGTAEPVGTEPADPVDLDQTLAIDLTARGESDHPGVRPAG